MRRDSLEARFLKGIIMGHFLESVKNNVLIDKLRNQFTFKGILSFILIFLVITLHSYLRLSELPESKIRIGTYFYFPVINFAAGKGFNEDNSFMSESPELSQFHNSMPYNKPPIKKLSLLDTFYDFKDYNIKHTKLLFTDSIGYRFLLGEIWKHFGFNWYYVGLINYLLSLIALISLMYCSYKILGVTYSVIIGLVFSLSTPEIFHIISYGRDGFPLWFGTYLLCALIMFVSKPITFNRITTYTILIGVIIFAAIQCRSSNIDLLPLVFIIYFILFFFFQKEKIEFKYSYLLKNDVLEKTFFFLFAVGLTFISTAILQELTYGLLGVKPAGHIMHLATLGLGIWARSTTPFQPSQLRYNDKNIWYLTEEYGNRVLHQKILDWDKVSGWYDYIHGKVLAPDPDLVFPWSDPMYQDTLQSLYLSFIKTYPHFFFYEVMWKSFYNTLTLLGRPCWKYLNASNKTGFVSLQQKYVVFFIDNYILFILSLVGVIILFYVLKLKKVAMILVVFALFNAMIAFIQYQARHLLLAHSAYYILCGVTIGFFFENTIKRSIDFIMAILGFRVKATSHFPYRDVPRKMNFLEDVSLIKVNQKFLLNALKYGGGIIFIICLFYLFKYTTLKIEQKNIKEMQVFFNALDKKPLKDDLNKNRLELPQDVFLKTVGIYCEIGRVTKPKPIKVDLTTKSYAYTTTLYPVVGKKVMLFIPIYLRQNTNTTLKFQDVDKQCKSYYWSDLSPWKGSLWEGSYDIEALNKNE